MTKRGWHHESARHSLASRGVHTRPIVHRHRYTVPMKSAVRTSAYKERQMETFARFNTTPADWKWNRQPPDEVEMGICDLCGYNPLRWVYTISLVTPGHPNHGHKLGIGSECVNNFFLADDYEKSLFRTAEGNRKKTVAIRNRLMKDYNLDKEQAELVMSRFGKLQIRKTDRGPELQTYGSYKDGGYTRYGWHSPSEKVIKQIARWKRQEDTRLWFEHAEAG